MTDKQIIIDVTQCPYYMEGKFCVYLSYKTKCEGDCNWTSYKEMEEQLNRKEQECEYWKHQAELGIDTTDRLTKELEEKEQECERLKEDLIEAKAHGDYLNNLALSKTLDTVSNELDQLKSENEDLKKNYFTVIQQRNVAEQQLDQLKKANEEKNELLAKLGCPTIATARMKAFTLQQQLDQLKGVIKKYEECNKYLVEENGKTYTRLEYKLLKTLTEIKPTLEFYANSTIGEEQEDGTYRIELSHKYGSSNMYGAPCYYKYNPKLARQALQKIKECEVKNEQ